MGPVNSFLACQPCSYLTSQRWATTSNSKYFLESFSTHTRTRTFFEHTISFHIHTNIHTLLCFPNGLYGTATLTATITSVPAVEHKRLREKQQQMLHSQLQDYLSLNKLHYCIYYPGIHSLGKSTLQDHCLPRASLPHTVPLDYAAARNRWRLEGERSCKGGNMKLILQWPPLPLPGQCVLLKQLIFYY